MQQKLRPLPGLFFTPFYNLKPKLYDGQHKTSLKICPAVLELLLERISGKLVCSTESTKITINC